jgi:hypothetical protein
VFEGRASESLTCNALEWIYSYGGGSVIEPDKRVTINNPNAIKALDTGPFLKGAHYIRMAIDLPSTCAKAAG